VHGILSQPGGVSSGNAAYVSPTFTPLSLQGGALSTDVRGGFDSFGNSTANVAEYNLGNVLQPVVGLAAAPFVEYGNQVSDDIAALGGATDGLRSTFAQQVTAGNYGSAALTELTTVASVTPLAVAGGDLAVQGLGALAPQAGLMMERYAAGTGILSYAGPEGGLLSSGVVPNSVVTRSVGSYTVDFTLDANGNTISASGSLQQYFTGGVRSSTEIQAQAEAAGAGEVGDQGGHLVGYRFLPEQGSVNLFPQNGNFNTSAFKTLENDYGRYIDQGYQVNVNHTLGDFSETGRPGSLSVTYGVVDGEGNLVDSWSGQFLNQAGQVYVRRVP
jgi:hypothetical protein